MSWRGGVIGVLAAVAIGFATVAITRPAWYVRLTDPVSYPHPIVTHAHNYGLPPELVAAVIHEESGFDAHARSQAGAIGLMQLTPTTARGIALRTGGHRFRTKDLDDPEINIRYGCWYLRHLQVRAVGRGDATGAGLERWIPALASYNAGEAKVRSWLAKDDDHQLDIDEIPYRETRTYVRSVLDLARDYRRAYPELTKGS
jgi:soluble lytic murein transglycosylase